MYMAENDYPTVAAIANERSDIGITASSTPTGHRGTFWRMCTDAEMGYTHWHFPSQRSPLWNQEMEDRAKQEYNDIQYEHEVLAEFGTEEAGVFSKEALDLARNEMYYTYEPLTNLQIKRCEKLNLRPLEFIYRDDDRAPQNLYRTCGVDFDKFQASSSIIVLDYDIKTRKFWVMKRIEVPRGEYTLDNAVNWIIKVNKIYNPRWIFIDRGYGDYQLERLHIYGDTHPNSGLKVKVVGYQFANKIPVTDPVTRKVTQEPLKPFMVNALSKVFEDNRMILSPFDDVLHKQLVDYTVERVTKTGTPVYTSKNEHFVDALGLAYLAMVLNFPDITRFIEKPKSMDATIVGINKVNTVFGSGERAIRNIESARNAWGKTKMPQQIGKAPGEREGDYQKWIKVPLKASTVARSNMFSRSGDRGNFSGRSLW